MGRDAAERPERALRAEGAEYRAIEAWRGERGRALCYFLAAGDDDRRDRRALLEPGQLLAELSEERLGELFAAARRLTATERRFADRAGRPWLAQNIGPVWAEETVAADITGVLFTSLEGPLERESVASGHVGSMETAELERLRERAFGRKDGEPAEP